MAKLSARAEVSIRLPNGTYTVVREGDKVDLGSMGEYYVCAVNAGFLGRAWVVTDDERDRYNKNPATYIRLNPSSLFVRVLERG